MLMMIFFKHSLSQAALIDLLEFIVKILPGGNIFPKSVHLLFRYIEKFAPDFKVTKHYFSGEKKEMKYVGTKKKKQATGYFQEIDLEEQIRFLFENRKLGEHMMHPDELTGEDTKLGDVITGSEYRRVNEDRKKFDLILMCNTDGLKLYKSTRYHCWPIMVKIMEIAPQVRDRFIIIWGVWCSKVKPVMKVFFQPMVQKMKSYFTEGISWKHPETGKRETTRLTVPLVVADSPGRADLQEVQHHMGTYPCNMCEIKTDPASKYFKKKRTNFSLSGNKEANVKD